MKKYTNWFTHDYNARSDEKIIELLSKHGMTGYGIWWGIIESLYNNTNVLQLNYDRIAYELHADSKIVESVINDFDLFVFNNGSFGSDSVERRLDERKDISVKRTQSINKRWHKVTNNTNESETDTIESKTDTITDIHTDIHTDIQFFSEKINSIFKIFIQEQKESVSEERKIVLAEHLEKLAPHNDESENGDHPASDRRKP